MPQRLAAIDLGSNSFRLQIAQWRNGRLRLEKRIRAAVRLASFLDHNQNLSLSGFYQAVQALNDFHRRLKNFSEKNVSACGTFALRIANNAPEFLPLLEDALGFPIRVLSGQEEAQYIFRGMQSTLPVSDESRLFIDIGGGSTEIICAKGQTIATLKSFPIGCVTQSARFFQKGKITSETFSAATEYARHIFWPLKEEIARIHWQNAFGSSGSVRATIEFLKLNHLTKKQQISRNSLQTLVADFLKTGDFSTFQMGCLRPDRIAIMPAGFSILCALFECFDITHLHYAKGALCQGLLEEMRAKFDSTSAFK